MSNQPESKGIRPHTPPDGQPKPKKKQRTRHRSPMTKAVISTLQFGFIFYAALVIALMLLETRLVYPGAYMGDDAGRQLNASAGIETVEYATTDRLTLSGRLLERPGSDRIVLVFHGNAQKAMWLDGWLLQIAEAFDATTMMAEYRGYADEKTPSETGVVADCLAARDFLCERFDKKPTDIILFGRSLGGGCAVAVAASDGAAGLILDRTFDSTVNVAAGKYPFVPVKFLMKNRFDSLARITVYDGPLVSVHGTNDEVIPVENGRRVYDRARGPKRWIQPENFGHLDPMPIELYQQIAAELNQMLDSEDEPTPKADNEATQP
ncbi:MAG: alpha/beta hydrolase [Planctomycetota bacterium]